MRTFLFQSFVAMLFVAQGCSGGDSGGGETGGGGAGGHAASGGVAPAAGKGGTSSDGGRGGHGGVNGGSAGAGEGGGGTEGGSGGTCEAPLTANMPWLYEVRVGSGEGGAGGTESSIGAGGAAGSSAGGSGGEPAAPCAGAPQETGGLRCEGIARARVDSNGTRLVFSDGSALLATNSLSSEAFVANETVWVRYEEEWRADCPFCGGRARKTLEARTAPGGTLLTFAQGGELKPSAANDRSIAIGNEIFGNSLGSKRGCTYDFNFDCYAVRRTLDDYELATTPPQSIPHGVTTRVVTAAGETFDVLLSTATQTLSRIGTCQDGRTPPDDATFIVSRVNAP